MSLNNTPSLQPCHGPLPDFVLSQSCSRGFLRAARGLISEPLIQKKAFFALPLSKLRFCPGDITQLEAHPLLSPTFSGRASTKVFFTLFALLGTFICFFGHRFWKTGETSVANLVPACNPSLWVLLGSVGPQRHNWAAHCERGAVSHHCTQSLHIPQWHSWPSPAERGLSGFFSA